LSNKLINAHINFKIVYLEAYEKYHGLTLP